MPPAPKLPPSWKTAWALAVLLILWWTLLPFRYDFSPRFLALSVARIQWFPFVERGRLPLWSDVVENVVLFIPFGVAGWRCLEQATPGLGEPTHGAIVGRDFVFIANSGWDRVGDDERLRDQPGAAPAELRRIALGP